MKKHKYRYRLLALTLALLTIANSVPATVYADEKHHGSTGGGELTPNPGDERMGWYNQTQGYRLYIINKNLERITPVYDFYNSNPFTFYDYYPDGEVVYKTETRFDVEGVTPSTGNRDTLLSVLQTVWCSDVEYDYTAPTIPYIYKKKGGTYYGNGEEFKKWFFGGEEGLLGSETTNKTHPLNNNNVRCIHCNDNPLGYLKQNEDGTSYYVYPCEFCSDKDTSGPGGGGTGGSGGETDDSGGETDCKTDAETTEVSYTCNGAITLNTAKENTMYLIYSNQFTGAITGMDCTIKIMSSTNPSSGWKTSDIIEYSIDTPSGSGKTYSDLGLTEKTYFTATMICTPKGEGISSGNVLTYQSNMIVVNPSVKCPTCGKEKCECSPEVNLSISQLGIILKHDFNKEMSGTLKLIEIANNGKVANTATIKSYTTGKVNEVIKLSDIPGYNQAKNYVAEYYYNYTNGSGTISGIATSNILEADENKAQVYKCTNCGQLTFNEGLCANCSGNTLANNCNSCDKIALELRTGVCAECYQKRLDADSIESKIDIQFNQVKGDTEVYYAHYLTEEIKGGKYLYLTLELQIKSKSEPDTKYYTYSKIKLQDLTLNSVTAVLEKASDFFYWEHNTDEKIAILPNNDYRLRYNFSRINYFTANDTEIGIIPLNVTKLDSTASLVETASDTDELEQESIAYSNIDYESISNPYSIKNTYRGLNDTIESKAESYLLEDYTKITAKYPNLNIDDRIKYAIGNARLRLEALAIGKCTNRLLNATNWDKYEYAKTQAIPYYLNKAYFNLGRTGELGFKIGKTNTIDLLTNNIPLAGEEKQQLSKKTPVRIMMQKENLVTFAEGYDYKNIYEAVLDGCYIVVENLIGFRVMRQCYPKKSYDNYWTYGSYWNIAQEDWVDTGHGYKGEGITGWYSEFSTMMAPYAMYLSKDLIDPETGEVLIKTPTSLSYFSETEHTKICDGDRLMASLTEKRETGADMYSLGLHIYSGKQYTTSTCDEAIKEPAPAPDDSKYIDDEDRAEDRDTPGYATIYKFYANIDASGLGYSDIEVFTREYTPRIITIENESDISGYHVVEFFESDIPFINPETENTTKLWINAKINAQKNPFNETMQIGFNGRTWEQFKASEDFDTVTISEMNKYLYILLEADDKDTQTYDPLLGNEPGASPDDSHKLTEKQKSDEIKYANIVKFYELTDTETGEVDSSIFVREKVPRDIKIIDELDFTNYAIEDWYTSTTLVEEVNSPTASYDNIKDYQYIAGMQRRTLEENGEELEENVIKLNENETTLYIKLVKSNSQTSTYDETLEDEPGASPDDTYLLTPDQQKNPTQYANIIKFYEEIDSDTKTIITSTAYERTKVPQIIEIEDEADTTGYALKEWFTSSDYVPYAEGYYFVEYKNNISISNLGTDAKTVRFIDSDGNHTGETTLYVLLQKETISENKKLPVTSTYDEDLGTEPGPAPDDSDRFDEAQNKDSE